MIGLPKGSIFHLQQLIILSDLKEQTITAVFQDVHAEPVSCEGGGGTYVHYTYSRKLPEYPSESAHQMRHSRVAGIANKQLDQYALKNRWSSSAHPSRCDNSLGALALTYAQVQMRRSRVVKNDLKSKRADICFPD